MVKLHYLAIQFRSQNLTSIIFTLVRAIFGLSQALTSTKPSSLDPVSNLIKQRSVVPRAGFGSSLLGNFTSGLPPLQPTVTKFAPPPQDHTLFHPPPLKPTQQLPSTTADSDSDTDVTTMGKPATRGSNKGTASTEVPHKANGQVITMKKADFQAFVSELNKKREFEEDLVENQGQNKKLKLDLESLEKEKAALLVELQEVKKELRSFGRTNKKRKGKNKKGPKSKIELNLRKDERVEDVEKAIDEFVKAVTFRNVKFAMPGVPLTNATRSIWEGIKDKMKLDQGEKALDFDEFADIYEGKVLQSLSARRTYQQSRCKDAAKGMFVWLFGLSWNFYLV